MKKNLTERFIKKAQERGVCVSTKGDALVFEIEKPSRCSGITDSFRVGVIPTGGGENIPDEFSPDKIGSLVDIWACGQVEDAAAAYKRSETAAFSWESALRDILDAASVFRIKCRTLYDDFCDIRSESSIEYTVTGYLIPRTNIRENAKVAALVSDVNNAFGPMALALQVIGRDGEYSAVSVSYETEDKEEADGLVKILTAENTAKLFEAGRLWCKRDVTPYTSREFCPDGTVKETKWI